MLRAIAASSMILVWATPASSAELIWKDRWNNMDQAFRIGYASAVYDTVQVLDPVSINLKNMPGGTIAADIAILIRTANKCIQPMKQVAEVRETADQSVGNRSDPKESVALIVLLAFIDYVDSSQLAYIVEEKSAPVAPFVWNDRWDREVEQFKNGFVAGAADTILYLAGMADQPTVLSSTVIRTAWGRCGATFNKSTGTLKTLGDLLSLSERAIHAQEDLFQLPAQTIVQALMKCNTAK